MYDTAESWLPNLFQSWNIAPMLEGNNLSYAAQNQSSIMILKYFVYRWQHNC